MNSTYVVKPLVGLMILLFWGNWSYGQSGSYFTVRDFETWNSITLNYKVSKKVKLGLEQQIRLNDNSSIWNQNFTELSGRLKLNKSFDMGLEYRYLKRNDKEGNVQGIKKYNRFAFYTKFNKELKRFKLSTRLQYQTRSQFGDLAPINTNPVQKLRWKIGADYNIRKWKLDPSFSAEIFQPLFTESDLEKYRLTLATKYDLKKWGSLKAFYRFEKEMNILYPLSSHIIGFNYTYTLKRKKK
jgi:hypothetical protein